MCWLIASLFRGRSTSVRSIGCSPGDHLYDGNYGIYAYDNLGYNIYGLLLSKLAQN
jgi:hypothetical protein